MTKYSITHAAMSFEHAVYAIFEHSGQAFARVAMILGQIFCDRHELNYWLSFLKLILLPGAKFCQTGESLNKFIGDQSLDIC